MRTVLATMIVLSLGVPAMAQTAQPVPVKAEPPATATAPAKPVTITVTFSDQEMAVLLRFIDLAVRQGGLSEASNAAYMANKFKEAAKTSGVAVGPPPKQGASP